MRLAQKTTLLSRPRTDQLARFVPLKTLDADRLYDLSQHARMITLPERSRIFLHGDLDSNVIFLLKGTVTLKNKNEEIVIHAGEANAFMSLDPHQPRSFTAKANTEITLIYIERNLLDILLTWDPYAGYQVNEINDQTTYYDKNDWMLTILKSSIFQKIPPIKIQVMFQKVETIVKKADDIVFSQGDEGDYFYLIKSGRCQVIRDTGYEKEKKIELAAGSSFGEEALLSKSPRNATVKMLDDSVLLRLTKEDFDDLFVSPVIESLDFAQAEALHAHGAQWIDVRQAEEYNTNFIPESINIPLNRIRESLDKISIGDPCIVYCDTGQRSACAAYLLNAYGYEAYVLDGGIQKLDELLI
ncbi:hypothetical protein MNBD_GAMMA21-1751 [hydrothermal vent metagenome]|uniref:Cyclic nucleotide-binding protein n=1 Tax=hydrothermal vent metagenome TaxID=652676 RepID=A0A3B0ZGD8_9ZZZZ